jgi:DNA-binding SARP family transcriptional activator
MNRLQTDNAQLVPYDQGLCIYLLGPPEIFLNAEPLTIARKQVRLLLYYLAACDQRVSFEHLRFLFWPDTADGVSQHHLARLLNHICETVNDPGILLHDETHIRLDRRQFFSDLRIFQSLSSPLDKNRSYNDQIEALELYRGPFLEGVQLNTYREFEHIIDNMRTGLEQKYLDLLECVINKRAEIGETEAAIELCHRYLQIDDLNERIHRSLIRLYVRLGKRELAIKQYQGCNRILQENLGIKPMMETQDLYQAVLEGRTTPGFDLFTNPSPVVVKPPALQFLGRSEFLSVFTRAFNNASLGQGNVLLINGASGKGKTRLLHEFKRQVDARSLCIIVDCHPAVRSIRHFLLLKILHYVQNLDPDLVKVDPALLVESKQVYNQINDLSTLTGISRNESGDMIPHDLWERIVAIFHGLASKSRPLVLFFDDLHHADAGTLNWLSFFADQINHHPCLLVGSYCCRSVDQLGIFRTQLLTMGWTFQECELEGLPLPAVFQAVNITFGDVVGCDNLAKRLHDITAGNPLYLEEILHGIFESGYMPQDLLEKDEWPLPENVWKAVEVRLARLSTVPRQIIENAAFMEQVFYFNQLASLLDVTEMELVDALEDLVCRNILLECNPGFQFRHHLVRLALRRMTSKTRQAIIEKHLQRLNAQLVVD